jgi:cysteine-S-conjugate beta-lyase
MDFKSPPEVVDAAVQAGNFGNFGYCKCPEGLVETVITRCLDLYDWGIERSWLVWLPGMVCALNASCRSLEKESSQVFTQTPIYPPFLSAPGNFDLPCVRIPMSLNADRFSFDFEAMDELSTQPSDLFMLCHPHNPVGTAFDSDELSRFAQWALERELYVCSDEIHCDLLLEPDLKHIPLAAVSPEIADRTITLMAPSKTFNLPGFGCSFAVISNGELRRKFKKAISGIVPDPPAMGFALAETAYRTGEPWRLELIDYLRENRDLVLETLTRIKGLIPYSPKATYLMWIDARQLPVENAHSFFENAGVGLSDGKDFGAPGFLRMNFGCSKELLAQALERMTDSCQEI